MKFGDFVWNDAGAAPGPVWVRIDLARQTLSVFRSDQEIGSTVILYGTDGKPTPTGVFGDPCDGGTAQFQPLRCRNALYVAADQRRRRADHARGVRVGAATHGCIGVRIDFARLLFAQVKRGDLVAIVAAGTQLITPGNHCRKPASYCRYLYPSPWRGRLTLVCGTLFASPWLLGAGH